MRDYIFEKVKHTTRHFRFGGIDVIEVDKCPSNLNLQSIFYSLEKLLPTKFFKGLKQVRIEHIPQFDDRNAKYS